MGELEEEIPPFEGLVARMGYAIEDAIHAGMSNDPVLVAILDIMIAQINENRPAFPNPLDEPVLYRRLVSKTKEALASSERFETEMNKMFNFAGGG